MTLEGQRILLLERIAVGLDCLGLFFRRPCSLSWRTSRSASAFFCALTMLFLASAIFWSRLMRWAAVVELLSRSASSAWISPS
ncbi:hypothetical protein P4119_17605 [Pseudomonas aeruginosa]|nr:hypothetical protein [Pseudomonas aeruginosa]